MINTLYGIFAKGNVIILHILAISFCLTKIILKNKIMTFYKINQQKKHSLTECSKDRS